ncbi:hypothetical protein LSH36_1g18004 [Paralvinella palmiformis]|uniref:Vacuolar protein sorting-associated protein 54 n=1 Tax=Paralvinella palmiformis TaxID=53620 RepID=A0AAD9KG44_9ANNE|nr:hypothetical protein LSH36_1g18004 [Paralvinella palmiformis]
MATGSVSGPLIQRPNTGLPVRMNVPWKRCTHCLGHNVTFKSPREFVMHLRDFHCTKEGGSFVCRYGPNEICPSLPLDGVSDKDYEDHVARFHVASISDAPKPDSQTTTASQNSSQSPSPTSSPALNEPSVVQDQHKWTIYQSCVNLPALLNDPRLTRREIDIFSKTWGESFERAVVQPSTHIPNITRDHFRRYIKRTSKRLQEHRRIKAIHEESSQSRSHDDAYPELRARKYDKYRAELEPIPKIFMHPGFNLENPDTFTAVFPWTKTSLLQPTGKSKQSSKLLQEKLSHYLDLVEVQIAKQISLRSSAFFEAMTSQDEVQHHLKNTCKAIKHLRDKLHQVNDSTVEGPLKILQLSRSRSNHVTLYNKLKLMSTVHQTQPMIQQLLSTNDFVGALDLIGTTQERETSSVLSMLIIKISSSPPRHLGSQLAEMEKVIDKMLQEEFVRYATADLNRPLSDSENIMEEPLTSECDVFGVPYELNDNQEKLVAIILGMLRQHKYNFVDVYREEACIAVKAVIKQTVIEKVAGAEDVDTEVGRSSEVEFMISQLDFVKVSTSLRDMLCHISDQAHDRCVKILTMRSKDGFLEKLTSAEFVILSRAIEQFVTSCEAICGKKSTSLRTSFQSQASRFVNRFHEERKTKLSLILDNERWKQADVPAEFQDLIDYIDRSGKLNIPDRKISHDKKPQEFLIIEGQAYAVVGTVLMLLKMVVEYCHCVEDIPTATPDILSRLVELLKLFNSRTCQLILGAGALQLVGLKTITTKNLALASRCLQVVVHYLPRVRRHFVEHLHTKNSTMVKHFDSVQKDYNDHIMELANKLVFIMHNMLELSLTKQVKNLITYLYANQWEVKAPMPSCSFRNISKQMTKLYEAIADLLPRDQIQDIFRQIHSHFLVLMRCQLMRLGVMNDGGPQHALVMADINHYTTSWRGIDALSDIELKMDDIWDKR